jgi:hypothetical protein
VATGFFWEYDLSHLYLHSPDQICKWLDKNVKDKLQKYQSAKNSICHFLNLKVGDLIAVKSHGRFGQLTIIAYAVVKELNGKVYEPDNADFPQGLGHIVHVEFLETNLWIETGLTYAKTIHKIVPGLRPGHFEKIFGSYSSLEESHTAGNSEEDDQSGDDTEDRINEKQTDDYVRVGTYNSIVKRTHNKIQLKFARFLKGVFPNDIVRTETNYIDVKRENKEEIYYYEIKPYNSAYSCVRNGIGQLLDYYHSNPPKSKKIRLVIVGTAKPNSIDLRFINFIKNTITIPFEYIEYDIERK